MSKPHKHSELIKAWADGAEIEYQSIYGGRWKQIASPAWTESTEYRIKPEPKPDIVRTTCVFSDGSAGTWPDDHNLKLTYDGETGKLKAAEVL